MLLNRLSMAAIKRLNTLFNRFSANEWMSPERSIKTNAVFIILNNVISQYIYLTGIVSVRQQSVVMRDYATRRKGGIHLISKCKSI